MVVWPWTVTKDHVRFGYPVEEAFKEGMPGGLLVQFVNYLNSFNNFNIRVLFYLIIELFKKSNSSIKKANRCINLSNLLLS